MALLARSKENLDPVVASIEKSGGKAIGYCTDVASEAEMQETFRQIERDFPESAIAAGIFNVGGTFKRGSFLDVSLADFKSTQSANTTGAFLFAQHVLRNQMAALPKGKFDGGYSPTVVFTGATASIKGGPASSAFAVGKFGVRALSQSLAREFSPKGIHVAHAIIDGIIGIGKSSEDRGVRTDSV